MFKMIRATPLLSSALLSGLLLSFAGHAQPAPDYNGGSGFQDVDYSDSNAVDPPSRVARLSLTNGAVSFVPAGENDWVEAQLNRPLVTGDKLWTDRGARAELQIGSSAIRVDEQSSFNFLNLDDNAAQVELTQGTLNLRVRRLYDGQSYEIDTPTLAFVINRIGEYRIDVAPDGNGTIVTAFHGGGDAYGEAGARFRVEEGQSIRFNDPQLRDYVSNSVPEPDDFDRFAFARDDRWDRSPSRQYVSEEVIGYDDLDNNGSWNDEPEYGSVWYPTTVTAGWTPYSYGQWGWVGAYGWTWIDSSPWGFAPFHYGRWAYIRNRWGWCPGPVHVRPYYAPALVAFVGPGGPRLGFNVGGPVGWFPLGPRDVYVPGYRVSRNYFTNVNVYNTRITNITINNFYSNYSRGNFDYNRISYANRNINGALVAVPGNTFVGARPIRGSAVTINRETFANARVSGFAALAPTRESLAFRGNRAAVAPPQAVVNRNIIAATRPPPPAVSFAQRESQLQRDPGRALPVMQMRSAPNVLTGNEGMQPRNVPGRPNVNVVTTGGRPARNLGGGTVAPRSAINPNPQPGRAAENLPPSPRNNSAQVPNNGAVTQGRPVTGQQEHFPSTRYANPNAGTNGNATSNPRAPIDRQDNARNPAVQENRGITQQRAPVRQSAPTPSERPQQAEQPRRDYRAPIQQTEPQRQAPVERETIQQPRQAPELRQQQQPQVPRSAPQQPQFQRQQPQSQPEIRAPQPREMPRAEPQPRQEFRAPAQQQFQPRVQAPQPQNQQREAPQPRERPQRDNGKDKNR